MGRLVLVIFFGFAKLLQAETPERSAALMSLVESERSFARTCKEIGIRASFMKFFAEDGIAFKPEPFCYNEAVKDLPPPANPKAFLLEWEPQVAGVASSGELGYTTGPSVRTDNSAKDQPKRYGQFFSIWKKQKDGSWKVAVDIGTQTPAQSAPLGQPFIEQKISPVPISSTVSAGERLTGVMNLDRTLSASAASEGIVDAYLSRIDVDTRLHRENEMPIVGREAIRSHLNKQAIVTAWTPIAGDVSLSDDLGYTYGSYECKAGDLSTVEKGYYLHVWKRDGTHEWKLVADVANPQEPDKEK